MVWVIHKHHISIKHKQFKVILNIFNIFNVSKVLRDFFTITNSSKFSPQHLKMLHCGQLYIFQLQSAKMYHFIFTIRIDNSNFKFDGDGGISQFNGTSTPKGSYCAKTGDCNINSSCYSLRTALCTRILYQAKSEQSVRQDLIPRVRHEEAALMHPQLQIC